MKWYQPEQFQSENVIAIYSNHENVIAIYSNHENVITIK